MSPGRHAIDWLAFGISIGIVFTICLLLVAVPNAGGQAIAATFSFVTAKTGWLFIIAGFGCLLSLIALALSPYRKIKLGEPHESPRHSTLSWADMLFSTGNPGRAPSHTPLTGQ
ncbi:MAG: choline-glycine betaine transporter [Verrucomicrobiales bacterium]|jgi:choline-glycine betaine transporter